MNSRPHMGADALVGRLAALFICISTHGPTRGPTAETAAVCSERYISTHGPTRGPTCSMTSVARENTISTHGPTRGPTQSCPRPSSTISDFNSRPHTGADLAGTIILLRPSLFQLTAPHGGRLLLIYLSPLCSVISTHGPTRGPTIAGLPGLSQQ